MFNTRTPTHHQAGTRTELDFIKHDGVGRRSLEEIRAWLGSHGLCFAAETGTREEVFAPTLQAFFDDLWTLGFRPTKRVE